MKYSRHDLLIYIFSESDIVMNTTVLMHRLKGLNLDFDVFRPQLKMLDYPDITIERVIAEHGVITIAFIKHGVLRWFQTPKRDDAVEPMIFGNFSNNAFFEIINKM